MISRPTAVAFDMIETVFSLEPLRARLTATGLPGEALETWFARILRDGFALEVTATYQPFRQVASAALARLLSERGVTLEPGVREGILEGFAELEPHPDARAALERLYQAKIRVVALTNGAADVTGKLLRRARLDGLVERVISIDEVHHWKPREAVYLHAAARVGVEPSHLALVATHPWDIHGAGQAGLITAFVARGRPYPLFMTPPDVTGASLLAVIAALVGAGDARAR